MKKILFYILLLATILVNITINAATANQQLEKLLDGFHTMQANFTQTLLGNSALAKQKSSGTMALERPGKFRWDVQKPDRQLILADGKFLWIYDVDLEQATQQRLNQTQANSPAMLLSGSIGLLKVQFNVSRIKKQGTGERFRLTPKSNEDMFQWIELQFIDGKLAGMRLMDNLGSESLFTFTNVRINPHLSNRLFIFKAPSNVDVITN